MWESVYVSYGVSKIGFVFSFQRIAPSHASISIPSVASIGFVLSIPLRLAFRT